MGHEGRKRMVCGLALVKVKLPGRKMSCFVSIDVVAAWNPALDP